MNLELTILMVPNALRLYWYFAGIMEENLNLRVTQKQSLGYYSLQLLLLLIKIYIFSNLFIN